MSFGGAGAQACPTVPCFCTFCCSSCSDLTRVPRSLAGLRPGHQQRAGGLRLAVRSDAQTFDPHQAVVEAGPAEPVDQDLGHLVCSFAMDDDSRAAAALQEWETIGGAGRRLAGASRTARAVYWSSRAPWNRANRCCRPAANRITQAWNDGARPGSTASYHPLRGFRIDSLRDRGLSGAPLPAPYHAAGRQPRCGSCRHRRHFDGRDLILGPISVLAKLGLLPDYSCEVWHNQSLSQATRTCKPAETSSSLSARLPGSCIYRPSPRI